jgi:D-lyxose ketol-isomerase
MMQDIILPETVVKRSEINHILQAADEFIRSCGFYLPSFAYWTPQEWQQKGPEVSEIVENYLGWDITDFGLGNFYNDGLFLFTIRNGSPANLARRSGKLYAEKIMAVEDRQMTPLHFHWSKMEDIINRGGGRLLLRLYNATPDEGLDETNPVQVSMDGVRHTLQAGEVVELAPGESITLPPYCYHEFWGQGRVLIGEVSLVNDDQRDNRFYRPVGRFPTIEEDAAPLYLLVGDYGGYYRAKPAA